MGRQLSTCDILSLWYTKGDMQAHQCKNCGALLTGDLERLDGEWALPCWNCGAQNLVAVVLQIVGWRA